MRKSHMPESETQNWVDVLIPPKREEDFSKEAQRGNKHSWQPGLGGVGLAPAHSSQIYQLGKALPCHICMNKGAGGWVSRC